VCSSDLDRSFIQEIGKPKNADLVRTMIMVAKNLGMEAIAEGIET
jgi:EAL domain-containing protein (putative c-di-GMP-specific phosphodiesterase class I)